MADTLTDRINKISDAFDTMTPQRDAANEDMRFCNVDGGMWEDWQTNRASNRSKPEFDVVSDFVNRYVGEQKLNRAAVLFTPDDDATSEDDAKLINGVYRADYADNSGRISHDNAIEEVAECGTGAFRFIQKFEDEENPENDNQDIHWAPIYNSFNTVIWDPQSKRIDKKDAKWCCVLEPYTKDSFEDTYPDATPCSAYIPTSRKSLDWYSADQIYVAEYYEVQIKTVKVYVYRNVELQELKVLDQKQDISEFDQEGWEFVRERKTKRRKVKKTVFTCREVLEEEKNIAGKWIPVISLYGFRKFVDGSERYRGLVRKLKDANRFLNSNIARVEDVAATSPDAKPIFYPEEIEGQESIWSDPDGAYRVKNLIYDENGNPIINATEYVKPPQIDPNTALGIEISNNFIQRATGNAPQDTIDPDASGKAINALLIRENLNTQTMTDNILVGLDHSGDVYLSMAQELYADLRSKNTLGEDGKEARQRLNTETLDDAGKPALTNTITGKKFKVRSKVGPAYETQREATVETLERMVDKASTVPALEKYVEPLVAMWLKNITGTGLEELKKFNRDEMLKMGLTEPETEEEVQFLEQLGQIQNPADKLAEAAAMQQQAEAANLVASAKNKEADTVKKVAETQKTKAQTVEILEQIGRDTDGVRRLRFNPQTGGIEGANGNRATRPN